METMGTDYTVYYTVSPMVSLLALVWSVLLIVALWRVYTKAGEHGWAAIVPFYNTYVLFRVAGFNPWLFLLLLIPIVNIVMGVIVLYRVAVNFGKSPVWAIFLGVIFNAIGLLIIGFGSATFGGRRAIV